MSRASTIKAWRKLIARIDENNERYIAGAYGHDDWTRIHEENMASYESLQPKYARL